MSKGISSYFHSTSNDGGGESRAADKSAGTKYQEMPLKEKRKLYKCGSSYVVLDETPLWPVLYMVNAPRIRKAIERQVSENSKSNAERKFKWKLTSGDEPNESFSTNTELNLKLSLWQGDITKLEIDAIVNAANSSLRGGGGVDGSIHRAAGPTLVKECIPLGGCDTGDAKITRGHKLPAKYVIHTVGPFGKNPTKLQSCYNNCLRLAKEHNIKSLAFCCIATGVYGYPNRDAAHVALRTTRKWLEKNHNQIERIIFCTFLANDFEIYQELMADKYFPCDPKGGVAKDTSGDENEEKVPVETDEFVDESAGDEHVNTKIDKLPSESTNAMAERNIATETDDLSLAEKNKSPIVETAVVGGDTDVVRSMDEKVVDNKSESSECCNVESSSGDIIESSSQDPMELGSQDVCSSQDEMEFGSQQI